MEKILVTGGAGFIGSHVVRAFRKRGASVTVLDNLTSGKEKNLPPDVRFIKDDIRSHASQDLVKTEKFDVICHLAAQIDVRRSVAEPAYDAEVNIGGTLNLLEGIRASGKLDTRFIFSSTGGALYGDLVLPPTPEIAAKDPQSPYGNSKLSVEYYLGYYARIHGLATVSLRYGNVYGPRQDSKGEAGVVAIFCERLLSNQELTVFGDGKQTRDYVYAGDVAEANVLAATRPLPKAGGVDTRAYNIGTSVETDVVTLAETLKDISESTVEVFHAPARVGEVQRSGLDITKASEELGWTPQFSLEAGLRATFEWFKQQSEDERLSATTSSEVSFQS